MPSSPIASLKNSKTASEPPALLNYPSKLFVEVTSRCNMRCRMCVKQTAGCGIAEGDLVATRWQFEATHTGVYLGRPPTGKRAIWTGVQIDRVANGRIVESWVDWDKCRLFETLGFVG